MKRPCRFRGIFFKQSLKVLQQEGIVLAEEDKSGLSRFLDNHFVESFLRDPSAFSVKSALVKRIIKSLEGSRGLSLKAAQMASFLELGLSPDLPALLGDLQLKVKPLSFVCIQDILKSAYENPRKHFAKVSPEPLAVTSIAQLHRATLLTGEEVVLKIRHPDIETILQGQFKKLSFFVQIGKLLGSSVQELLEEIEHQVFQELDYEREVINQERFRNIFAHHPRIVILAIHRDLCRQNIIVSNYERGLPFATFAARANSREKVGSGIVDCLFS